MSIWSRTATTNLLHHTTHECERALHRSRFWCVDTKILVRLLLQYRTTIVPNFNQTHNVYRISRPQRRISTFKSKTFNTTPKVTPDSLSLHLSHSSPLHSTPLHSTDKRCTKNREQSLQTNYLPAYLRRYLLPRPIGSQSPSVHPSNSLFFPPQPRIRLHLPLLLPSSPIQNPQQGPLSFSFSLLILTVILSLSHPLQKTSSSHSSPSFACLILIIPQSSNHHRPILFIHMDTSHCTAAAAASSHPFVPFRFPFPREMEIEIELGVLEIYFTL